jgi:hypothetical protein
MDKTNVTIKIPGKLLNDDENFINVDDTKMVEKLIPLLQSRKNIVNVTFQSNDNTSKKNVDTITKIEILLSDENAVFNYYED